jgi:hypothetical protein
VADPPPGDRTSGSRGPVTARAIAAGLLGSALLGVVTPYSDLLIRGTWIACAHLPIGVFVLFVLLLGWGALISRLLRRPFALSGGEAMVAYVIMLVGAGIPSFGLTEYLVPTMAGAFYFASPENGWAGLFFRHIPQWLVPVDLSSYPGVTTPAWVKACYAHLPAALRPADIAVVRQFYEGLPQGPHRPLLEVARHIPWGPWLVPVAAWTLYAAVLWAVLFCVSVVVRRQWIERERLTFPLVQLPLEMVRGAQGPGQARPFFRNPVMWAGFAVPFLLHSMNSLHVYWPSVPEFALIYDLRQRYLVTPPWNQLGILTLWCHFSVIGFSFLLPTDLSFSLWFFYFLSKAENLVAALYGAQIDYVPNYPVPTYAAMQMLGAFLVCVIYMAWLSRPHLREVWRQARRGGISAAEAGEAISCRAALVGLAGGLLILSAMVSVAGVNFALALLVFILFLVIAIVLTRFVAEGGLLFIQAPFRPTDMIATVAGINVLGAQTLTVLAYVERISMFDLRAFLMPSLTDTWRIADAMGIVKRRLVPALAASIALATVTSCASLLFIAYRHGAVALEPWFAINSPQQPFTVLASYLRAPPPFRAGRLELVGVGAAVMWFLFWMRARFVWWPFHPIGYAMGPSWPMIQLWFSIFAGWLLKSLILRFGGMRLFTRARPLFLGLVLGEFSVSGVWLIVDALTGVRGHRFFLT